MDAHNKAIENMAYLEDLIAVTLAQPTPMLACLVRIATDRQMINLRQILQAEIDHREKIKKAAGTLTLVVSVPEQKEGQS